MIKPAFWLSAICAGVVAAVMGALWLRFGADVFAAYVASGAFICM